MKRHRGREKRFEPETAADLIGSMAATEKLRDELHQLLRTTSPPDLGPGPRPGVPPQNQIDKQVDSLLAAHSVSGPGPELIRCLALLWHDHLDAAHEIAQNIPGPDGSFLHGMMHRREPDYANAKYWFRRVGQHPCFPEIARRVGTLLDSCNQPKLKLKFLPKGNWDPMAFIDACEAAAGLPPSDPHVHLLQEIQNIEFEVLLGHVVTGSPSN
jgi:hypothetical protein